jgi:hypothetical protein
MQQAFIGIRTDTAFTRYATALAADFCGLDLRCDEAGAISYESIPGERLRIPKCHGYTTETIPAIPTAALHETVSKQGADFPFDLFEGIRFWLCDQAHTPVDQTKLDPHQRLSYPESAQSLLGHGTVPIINSYLNLFGHWLTAQMDAKRPLRRARIVLTHDVDDPLGPGDISHGIWVMGAAALAGKFRATVGQIRGLPRKLSHRLRDPNSTYCDFESVISLEAQFGMTSTFNFASAPWWMRGASPYDVAYDVRSPRFKRLLSSMRRSGAEIGLHLSYNTDHNHTLLQNEKTRLERAAGQNILGGRHHYWHMSAPFWPTLRLHEKVGLAYDTSIGFNNHPGYRLGIGHPFFPWDPTTESAIGVLQIPTALMDGALLYDETETVRGALDKVDILLSDLKANGATAAIDWHARTSCPGAKRFKKWASVYHGLLERLAEDPEIDIVTPREILSTSPLAAWRQTL